MKAPVILFAYNRPEHLMKTLTALAHNEGAKDTNLYVFIDGPKNDVGIEKNREVLKVAKKFEHGCFKSVAITNSEKNRGLAASVISGVSTVIDKHHKVIVTEDDAVSAPGYLNFMNGALDFYEKDPRIWSVGGYTVPMQLPEDYTDGVIMTQRSSSYAWATWKDRWDKIDWDMRDYRKFRFDFPMRARFNRWGNDRASMLDDQMNGRVNSWAIRFDYAMFKNDMYNIVPRESLIQNIGHDGSGTHNVVDNRRNDPFAVSLENADSFVFTGISIDARIRKEFIKPFASSKISLLKRFVGNLIYKG